MSDEKKPNNPRVFPHTEFGGAEHYGMTLRDWFAGQALAGLLAKGETGEDVLADVAYSYADDMMKARQS